MFADRPAARQDNRDVGGRDIDAFVEDFARDDDGIGAVVEAFENGASFLDRALVGDGGDEVFAADAVNCSVVGRKDDRAVGAVLGE